MMVSIIIPIYNVEDYIVACLESVVAQIYTDYEVILVDDCGTDRSMERAERFVDATLRNENESYDGNREKWRIVRHEKNRGLSAARNTGTVIAKGKYIYYLDSDDTITHDCLEKLVAKAESTEAEMVVGDINVIGDDQWIPKLKSDVQYTDDCFHDYLQGKYYMMAWNKLVRRDFLERNGITFVEGLIHEDCAWSFTVACVAKKIAFVHEKTYNYLVRSNSIQTGKDFTKHFDAYCTLLRYYADEAVKYGRADDSAFRWWYERQKALHFGQARKCGTKEQMWNIYSVIRQNLPTKGWNKMQIHYSLPSFLGVIAYKKWHGMWLM